MIDICLLGTGGMVPLKYRWLTSLYAKCGGKALLIDCGEGTQIAASEAGCHLKNIDMICLTHFHADHVAGLPGLLLSMGNSGRTEPVTICGPTGLLQVLRSLLIIAPTLPFDIITIEIGKDSHQTLHCGDLEIHPFAVDHVIPCLGYSVTLKRSGKFMPEKARQYGIPVKSWKLLQSGESIMVGDKLIMPEMVIGPERKGLKFVYSTDTRPVQAIIDEGMGADLMILEGIYADNEMQEKAKKWGHMTMLESAALAKEARAKALWFTHFSQSLPDPWNHMDEARKIFPEAVAGRDGMKATLNFGEVNTLITDYLEDTSDLIQSSDDYMPKLVTSLKPKLVTHLGEE
ncbi:MAG: ribonuclease Z [Eubacteriales bacterium]|nr:ribonuclease Z [Eubacteriales bacterium]